MFALNAEAGEKTIMQSKVVITSSQIIQKNPADDAVSGSISRMLRI